MKTFIRRIIVLVVLNLAMGSFALAEYATEEEPALIADEEVGVVAVKTTGEADIAVKRAYNYIYTTPYKSSVTKKQPSGAGVVLVIPSAEMKEEEFAAIMEDLSVMSRIFDKKVTVSQVSGILGDKVLINGKWYKASDIKYYDYVLSPRDKRVTEAIYLGGFGAMFLTSVDFPLSPPPKVEDEKKVEEDVDTVWEQTKQEITMPKKETTDERQWWATSQLIRQQRQVQVYNAEKVEELKRTLTKALKHAANIRGLKGDEWVTVVVKGSAPAAAARITNAKLLNDGKIITRVSKTDSGSSSPTFLTIRAKKSDIDAFSKKELDDAEFRKRVQIITY